MDSKYQKIEIENIDSRALNFNYHPAYLKGNENDHRMSISYKLDKIFERPEYNNSQKTIATSSIPISYDFLREKFKNNEQKNESFDELVEVKFNDEFLFDSKTNEVIIQEPDNAAYMKSHEKLIASLSADRVETPMQLFANGRFLMSVNICHSEMWRNAYTHYSKLFDPVLSKKSCEKRNKIERLASLTNDASLKKLKSAFESADFFISENLDTKK